MRKTVIGKSANQTGRKHIRRWLLICMIMLGLALCFSALSENVLVMPDDLEIIEEYAFTGDTSIDRVELSYRIREIHAHAFAGSSLQRIHLTDSLTFIDDTAFDGPDSVTITADKGSYAWDWAVENGYIQSRDGYDYQALEDGTLEITGYSGTDQDIVIPSAIDGVAVTKIGDRSFVWCDITSVVIPKGILQIGDHAFNGCRNLTDVTLPDGLQSIGYCAFFNCSSLPGLSFPASVTYIDDDAFGWCSSMQQYTVDKDNTVYASEDGILLSKDRTKLIRYPEARTGSYTIPSSITSLGDDAFEYCSLTEVTVPSSVTNMGDYETYVFGYCPNLKAIHVDSENGHYASDEGVLLDKAKSYVIRCPGGFTGTYSIPEGVESVWPFAFEDCIGLTDLTIPDSMRVLNQGAFYGCSGLTNITVPEGVIEIYLHAFNDCSSLTAVYLPASLEAIGEGAFNGCEDLMIYAHEGSYAWDWADENGFYVEDYEEDSPQPPLADAVTLVYAEVNPIEGTIAGEMAKAFKRKVEELSGGSVFIDIQGSGVLGSEADYLDDILSGNNAFDICRVSVSMLAQYTCHKAKLLTLPYVFENREHFWKFANSNLAKIFLNEPQARNIPVHGLAYGEEGFRSFFFTKSVTDINDLTGLKIRVSTDTIMTGLVSSLGATPTIVSFSELALALQSGIVDGSEQSLSNYKANGFYEVAPYVLKDEHTIGASELIISDDAWNNLTEEEQDWVQEAADYAANQCRAISESTEAQILQYLETQGVTIINVSDKTPWRNAVQAVITNNLNGEDEAYQSILALK